MPSQSAPAPPPNPDLLGITLPSFPLAHTYTLYNTRNLLSRFPFEPSPETNHLVRRRHLDLRHQSFGAPPFPLPVSLPEAPSFSRRLPLLSCSVLTCTCASSPSRVDAPTMCDLAGVHELTRSSATFCHSVLMPSTATESTLGFPSPIRVQRMPPPPSDTTGDAAIFTTDAIAGAEARRACHTAICRPRTLPPPPPGRATPRRARPTSPPPSATTGASSPATSEQPLAVVPVAPPR